RRDLGDSLHRVPDVRDPRLALDRAREHDVQLPEPDREQQPPAERADRYAAAAAVVVVLLAAGALVGVVEFWLLGVGDDVVGTFVAEIDARLEVAELTSRRYVLFCEVRVAVGLRRCR